MELRAEGRGRRGGAASGGVRAGLSVVRSLVVQEAAWWGAAGWHGEVLQGRAGSCQEGREVGGLLRQGQVFGDSTQVLMQRCSVYPQLTRQKL